MKAIEQLAIVEPHPSEKVEHYDDLKRRNEELMREIERLQQEVTPELQRQVRELNLAFARLATYATLKDPDLAEQLLGEKPSYEDLKKIIGTLEGLEAKRKQKEEKA